ncbi:hypothetical protein [Streptomyces sp. NPDC101150]|uniref:hypothetical protein n=1 Tax=Streptomyces sp. NPDC101150 TaxID=3366114 RepID=UPI003814CE2F
MYAQIERGAGADSRRPPTRSRALQADEQPLRTYPGEAAGYRALEEWTGLGLGSAVVPHSKLTSPDVPHHPLVNQGREVQIPFEALWSAESALGTQA